VRRGERLRALWLRWDRVVLALALLLPVLASSLLGFLWLWERGWMLAFLLGSLGLVALIRLARWAALRGAVSRGGPGGERPLDAPLGPLPGIPADWSGAETAALDRARARIRAALPEPVPWDSLPARALAEVEAVASDLSGGRRGALDFTAPEALLLVGLLAARYRRILLEQVPFADRLSIQALWWVWQRQGGLRAAAEGGWLAWRGLRLMLNPAGAVLREVEQLLAAGLQDRLGRTLTRDLQARLLDEAARAAIELYSGRLRFSEAELAAIALPETARDAEQPEAPPLRVLLVGQLSAGKSTLLNALAGQDLAETDAAPVTERTQAVELELDGTRLRLVDTPGLDGSAGRCAAVAQEAAQADLLLWVLRADRPDRSPDHALRAELDRLLAATPERRAPPVVSVVAAADLLLPGWPWPEHALPPVARHRLDAALEALAADWPGPAVPLSAEPEPWNLSALLAALTAALPEARQVQRQRQRLAGARAGGARATLVRAGRGLRSAAGVVAGALTEGFRRKGG